MSRGWRLYLRAVQFLTRLPVTVPGPFVPEDLQHCLRFFPLVGATIGLILSAVLWGAQAGWSAWVSATLVVAASVYLTGAFHEDGLADTLDGLGGAVSRARALEIMKDSRIGTYGAAGLVLSLMARVALLAEVLSGPGGLWWAMLGLVWTHTASRLSPVALVRVLPYAGDADHAKAKPLAMQVSAAGVARAGTYTLLVAGLLWLVGEWAAPALSSQLLGALGLSAAVLALWTWWMRRWLNHRLGGFTGDTLGATQQGADLLLWLVWAAMGA